MEDIAITRWVGVWRGFGRGEDGRCFSASINSAKEWASLVIYAWTFFYVASRLRRCLLGWEFVVNIDWGWLQWQSSYEGCDWESECERASEREWVRVLRARGATAHKLSGRGRRRGRGRCGSGEGPEWRWGAPRAGLDTRSKAQACLRHRRRHYDHITTNYLSFISNLLKKTRPIRVTSTSKIGSIFILLREIYRTTKASPHTFDTFKLMAYKNLYLC